MICGRIRLTERNCFRWYAMGTGKSAAEELLFLEEAAPTEPAAAASPAGYALAGAVPMVAVPVRYPDGRLMYHVYPVAQPAVQVHALHCRAKVLADALVLIRGRR